MPYIKAVPDKNFEMAFIINSKLHFEMLVLLVPLLGSLPSLSGTGGSKQYDRWLGTCRFFCSLLST